MSRAGSEPALRLPPVFDVPPSDREDRPNHGDEKEDAENRDRDPFRPTAVRHGEPEVQPGKRGEDGGGDEDPAGPAVESEWMIRAFAIVLGISTVRVVGMLFDVALTPTGVSPRAVFVLSLWTGVDGLARRRRDLDPAHPRGAGAVPVSSRAGD
ncbi:MAG TPA: hypothetical protein VNC59_03320 [Thermoanaerobaculia bacterium]|nr:hypothetical protein [Thermoanaerobaculia bacterium]